MKWWVGILVIVIGSVGCTKESAPPAPPSASPAPVSKTAEITFETKKLKLGNKVLTVEIADTPARTARGLMFRKELLPGRGMLFIFEDEEPRSFWMKNTFIPLSIGYFDSSKKLVDIQQMEPVKSIMDRNVGTYPSRKPAQYALEVPQGWFEDNKVGVGEAFQLLSESE